MILRNDLEDLRSDHHFQRCDWKIRIFTQFQSNTFLSMSDIHQSGDTLISSSKELWIRCCWRYSICYGCKASHRNACEVALLRCRLVCFYRPAHFSPAALFFPAFLNHVSSIGDFFLENEYKFIGYYVIYYVKKKKTRRNLRVIIQQRSKLLMFRDTEKNQIKLCFLLYFILHFCTTFVLMNYENYRDMSHK